MESTKKTLKRGLQKVAEALGDRQTWQGGLAEFAEKASHGYWQRAKHLDYLAREVGEAIHRGGGRLIIQLPPQHGKSTLVSEYLPAFFLGNYPDRRVILATYEASFAASWGRKARAVVEEWGKELFGVEVARDSSAAQQWDLEGERGGYSSAGIGGPIAGKSAGLLIIDDPVKNAEEARSKTKKEAVWDWWRTVARTRLTPNATVIIMMTRWAEDDLAGRILKHEGAKWKVISLPAIAEENDPLGRQPGEALWPERYPLEVLQETKEALGTYWFFALYQQRPYRAEGQIIKGQWFKYFTEETAKGEDGKEKTYYLLDNCGVAMDKVTIFHCVDLAVSLKETADYFVVGTFAIVPPKKLLVLDILRERYEVPEQLRHLQRIHAKWGGRQYIESKVYQLALVQLAIREGLPASALDVKGDKVTRAQVAAARYEAGEIYHRKGAPWLNILEDELQRFPNAEHDDMVDVVAYGAIKVGLVATPRVSRL